MISWTDFLEEVAGREPPEDDIVSVVDVTVIREMPEVVLYPGEAGIA